jgi:transcriptional regulator with XRE-family HTH domain
VVVAEVTRDGILHSGKSGEFQSGEHVGSFGKSLRTWRVSAGLTQVELAKEAGWSQSQVSRTESGNVLPPDDIVRRLDLVLSADGELFRALASERSRVSAERRQEWRIGYEADRVFGSDAGLGIVDQVTVATEELCCDYSWRDAREVRDECRAQFRRIEQLLEGRTTLREHRQLIVSAGWLALLLGCLENDLGREWEAEQARRAAWRLGVEAAHGEIIAWSFEMSAWYAFCRDRQNSVGQHVEAGLRAAPSSSVAIQLNVHQAKALARKADLAGMRQALGLVEQLVARHEHLGRVDNHFVIDPEKWVFFAMGCHRIAGDDATASDFAREVLRLSHRPDGTESNPMRAGEARLTLAIAALRSGELEEATEWARAALSTSRRTISQTASMVTDLLRLAQCLLPKDPAAHVLTEELHVVLAHMAPARRVRQSASAVRT